MKLPKAVIIRTYLLYFVVVIAMLAIIGKTFAIVMDGRSAVFTTESEKLPQRFAKIKPRRGEILDAHLNPLVTSVSFYDIYMDPVTVDKDVWDKGVGGLSEGLARIFPTKSAREYEEYLREARTHKNRYVLIHKKVTNEVRKELRELPIFREGRFKGGVIDNHSIIVRKRPHGELLRRTLGYVKYNPSTKDTLYVGLEGAYNSYLAGREGIVVQQKIARSWKPTGLIVRNPTEGYDIVTSINEDIQEVAQTELRNQLERKGGRYGCAIVMDVKTGFIKAMVNLQETSNGDYKEVYNNAIGTKEVLGSTMKLASLMACLEDDKVKLSDTVNAVGKYQFYDRTLTDSHPKGWGKITIKEAFEHSSNVIAKVVYDAYKDNPQQYIKRLKQFGITDKTEIKLQGEATPIYSTPGSEQWWGGSLAWMGIGYEFQLTPLQMLSFYNAVANDGKYMKPQMVTQVINNRKEVIKEFKPVVEREKIARQSSIDTMRDALEAVVLNGTGKHLQSAYFDIAGKTGTAQIANRDKGYGPKGEKKYIASFVGYFPADEPTYSCIVVVAAPTKDIYGASVSGTVFAAIANKVYASSYEYHKAVNENALFASVPQVQNGSRYELNTVLNYFRIKKELNGEQEWVRTDPSDKSGVVYHGYKFENGKIPDVRGMGLMDAVFLLEKQGLTVHSSGFGRVVHQSIIPGTDAVNGRVIKLKLN